METYGIFILTHGDLAAALIETVEKILGKQDNVFTYTNRLDSLPVLGEKISQQMEILDVSKVVFFLDLAGGSCWNLAAMIQRRYPNITLIAGVNLPMLISFFSNLNDLPFEQLIDKVEKDAVRGVVSNRGT